MDHQLVPYFPRLRRFESTRELLRSPLYARLSGEIDRVLGRLVREECGRPPDAVRESLRVTAWNIQRGIHLERVIETLETHPVMRESDVFPPMVVRMIDVGERTGALENMLAKIADFYEDQVDTAVAGLTSMIEPLLIVFLGVVIGFLVISMFMPMFDMINHLN